jgi:hypothetical protein
MDEGIRSNLWTTGEEGERLRGGTHPACSPAKWPERRSLLRARKEKPMAKLRHPPPISLKIRPTQDEGQEEGEKGGRVIFYTVKVSGVN